MKKIIVYGVGTFGEAIFEFLKKRGCEKNIIAFCDQNASNLKEFHEKPVLTLDEATKRSSLFLIAVGNAFYEEVETLLKKYDQIQYENIQQFIKNNFAGNLTEFEREFCALAHINGMDNYFRNAENKDAMSVFWKENGEFFRLFKLLNLENIIELACGHGRHVPKYVDKAKHITLVDILEKNISFCKERFKNYENITYYKNNGSDLHDLPNNSYTALFTYDAMVHLELLDIAKYLEETYRVLKPNSMALFHHSNNDANYKASYSTGSNGRSFMSSNIFAYLSYRVGFEIVEQKIIDWGVPNLDCLTLVYKGNTD